MAQPPTPSPADVRLSAHAAEQYQQRVKPALDLAAARAELDHVRLAGEITALAPGWIRSAGRTPFYLIVGNALALPLMPQHGGWVATTCVTQTTLTADRRAARAAHNARRVARRRAERRTRR